MDIGASTHPGYVRQGNEDGFFASREQAVFAVADGMGGHAHGEVASHLALETIAANAEKLSTVPSGELPSELHTVVQIANASILSQAEEQDARNRMGTTLVLATISGDRLYFAHIGDSRLYLLRNGVFSQLTRDHSLVQTMVDRGEISPEEAATHPLRHQITRVVGGDDRVSPEIASQALQPGDVILLCTDGLSGAVDSDTIRRLLSTSDPAQQRSDALIKAALDAGGPDNITAVVVVYDRPRPLLKQIQHKSTARAQHGPWLSLLLYIVGLLVILGGMAGWQYTHPVYVIATDAADTLHLYMDWPLLPMLKRQVVPTPGIFAISLRDARPYMDKYQPKDGDMHGGIRVAGKDAGVALLHDVATSMASDALADAKSALEHSEILNAQTALNHAKAFHADPALIQQLELQLSLLVRKVHPAERLAE